MAKSFEEMAKELWNHLDRSCVYQSSHKAEEAIAAAIREVVDAERKELSESATRHIDAAVKEEREACEKIIEDLLNKCDGDETGIGCLMRASQAIKSRT